MRKTAQYKVPDEGRDKGKTFVITEMPSEQGEAWAMRALLGLMASGVELPDNYRELGMAGLAEVGFKALSGIRWEMLKPLLDEMFECVKFVGDPKQAFATTRELIPEDIEEISTRLKLRMEWWNLHMGFSAAAAQSLLGKSRVAAAKSPDIKTSVR